MRYHLIRVSCSELAKAWPQWRAPVTLGGGRGITNRPFLLAPLCWGLKKPLCSHHPYQAASTAFGLYLTTVNTCYSDPGIHSKTHCLEVRVIKRLYDLLLAGRCLVHIRRECWSLCLGSRCGLLRLRLLLLFQLGGLLLCCEFGSLLSSFLGPGLFFLLCQKQY